MSTVAFDASAKGQGGHVADTQAVTLVRYLLNEQAEHPETEPEFLTLIAQMAYVAKVIACETRRAALVGRLGQRSRSIARRSLV